MIPAKSFPAELAAVPAWSFAAPFAAPWIKVNKMNDTWIKLQTNVAILAGMSSTLH
jgi:hypothetical protein